MGVVLNLLGSDVMYVRQTVTVSGWLHLCKSNNGSTFRTTSSCYTIIFTTRLQIMITVWHVASVRTTEPIWRLRRQSEVCAWGAYSCMVALHMCVIVHILFCCFEVFFELSLKSSVYPCCECSSVNNIYGGIGFWHGFNLFSSYYFRFGGWRSWNNMQQHSVKTKWFDLVTWVSVWVTEQQQSEIYQMWSQYHRFDIRLSGHFIAKIYKETLQKCCDHI